MLSENLLFLNNFISKYSGITVYLVNRRKSSNKKKIILTSLFLVLIFLSNFDVLSNLNNIYNSNPNINEKDDDFGRIPFISTSNLNLTDSINDTGVNQTVRLYVVNQSASNNNNINSFSIPAPANNMYLMYGDFNVSFQNNFTAEHKIDGTDFNALNNITDARKYVRAKFNTNKNYSTVLYEPGLNLTTVDLDKLTDGNKKSSFFILNSSVGGVINFTISANFSNTLFKDGWGSYAINEPFDWLKVLGLNFTLWFNLSMDANFTIKMKDFNDGSSAFWKVVSTPVFYNHSLGPFYLNKKIIDENLNFINPTNSCSIQFVFERSDAQVFNATIYDFYLEATYPFELPITDQNYVALECDLRGEQTTIDGFYAWIRTLNRTKALNSELNITLYKANGTITRTNVNLTWDVAAKKIGPDYAEKIDSFIVDYNYYHGDRQFYFNFDTSKTANLSLYNYFIVIKSNSSENIYSLVTVPDDAFGDSASTHLLLTTGDNGNSWVNAKDIQIGSYFSSDLDASSFKLNVTRGYTANDFINNSIVTLKIDGISFEKDYQIKNSDRSNLVWGIGKWKKHNFQNSVANDSNQLFIVNLTWNFTTIKGFYFNVTYYYVKAYREENATSTYKAIYDKAPEWIFNYSLNLNHYIFDNWNFSEFRYVYLNYFNAYNLTTPSPYYYQVLSNTTGEQVFPENNNYKYLSVGTNIINVTDLAKFNGSYLLNLTSPNIIYDMHSYINFKGTLWETEGFMIGDNISIRLDIQDHNGLAPTSGNAQIKLFYPNGTRYQNHILTSSNGVIDDSILIYEFENNTIINLNSSLPIFGKYKLGYFWTNGSIIGCMKKTIYLDAYDLKMEELTYYPDLTSGNNVLTGNVNHQVYQNYTLIIATVNETTGMPTTGIYPINRSIDEVEGKKSINYLGEDLEVYCQSIMQNETILNPEETINYKVKIQNTHPIFDINVRVHIKLVSLAFEDWIICEADSITKLLCTNGAIGDTYEYSINLTMPTLYPNQTWYGVNGPVRRSGAGTIVEIFIEDESAGDFYLIGNQYYSLLVNQTEDQFEGFIKELKETKIYSQQPSQSALIKGFDRDECIYLPNKTTFIINVFDDNHVSSYNQFLERFELKMDSEFSDVIVNPSTPLKGRTFNVTSNLLTEFGDPLINKNITLQHNITGIWENISSQITNINGTTQFKVNTSLLNIVNETLGLRLIWDGDQYVLNNSYIFTVGINIQTNSISISFAQSSLYLYRDSISVLKFTIKNTGNSVLKIFNIDFNWSSTLTYEIKALNYLLLNYFEPGDTLDIIIEVQIPNLQDANINLTIIISGQNLISNELITIERFLTINLLNKSFWDYFFDYLTFVIIGLIALVWILAFFVSRRINKRIDVSPKEPTITRPRRGKYVKVSELKQKPMIVKEEVELPKEEEVPDKSKKEEIDLRDVKKRTDLDSLIEKDLEKKKKK